MGALVARATIAVYERSGIAGENAQEVVGALKDEERTARGYRLVRLEEIEDAAVAVVGCAEKRQLVAGGEQQVAETDDEHVERQCQYEARF